MKNWEIEYEGSHIRVEYSMFSGEKLFVNEKLQDEQIGSLWFRSRLYGKIVNKNNEVEKIKVSLGGNFSIHCRIFVNDTLIFPLGG